MDLALNIDGITADQSWEKAATIMNNVYLSLMVKRGSFFQNPDFGSRLHLLTRAKNTDATARLAKEYCIEALKWLKDTGRATDIKIETEKADQHRLNLRVQVTQANGRDVSFETFLTIV